MEFQQRQQGKHNHIATALLLLTVVACGLGWFLLSDNNQPSDPEPIAVVPLDPPTTPIKPLPVEPIIEPEPEPEPIVEPEPVEVDEPVVEPEPIEPEPEPLPSLDDSDSISFEALTNISDGMQIDNTLKQDNVLRRMAVFVDNLVAGEVMRSPGPLMPLSEPFPVLEVNNSIYLDPEGYRRFDQLADFMYRLDERQVFDQYLWIEPLIEEAYQELGYPAGQFRNTLSAAIAELLSAPEYDQPLALVSPSVNYKFADESIESRSDVHKAMIRMGPANARKVKSFLTRLQAVMNP